MTGRCTAVVSITVLVCLVGVVTAQEPSHRPRQEPVEVRAETTAPSATIVTSGWPYAKDDPEVETLDRDEFLGQVESAMSGQRYFERVDPFSGTLHINMTDVVLPGNAGLDIVIQRYYSSGVVNRVDNTDLTRHAASADMSGRLGDTGWQLHMGKLMNPEPGPGNHTTLIMPDGSTHTLYNRDGYPGQKISQEGWIYSVSGSVHTVRLTNGLIYHFDRSLEGAWYYYLGMDDGEPIEVLQCTRIEDLNGNAISIEYSRWDGYGGALAEYATLIDRVYFDDEDDDRSVEFTYWPGSLLLQKIIFVSGGVIKQTWDFGYGDPAALVSQPQHPTIAERSVNSLTVVLPPDGNAWLFSYYDLSEDWESGRWLMEYVQSPRASRTTYTWGPEEFDVGAEFCSNIPQFLALQTRQSSFHTGVGDDYEDEATTVYDYTNGGQEGATTSIVTTDSQTGVTLATEEHVFHGWGSYVLYDPDLWKVGLTKSSTMTTMDDGGEPLETVTTTSVWERGDVISQDTRTTSPWVGCGGFRQLSPVSYIRPTSVTRVVERHDSVPDPANYTTVSSDFDNWGNVGLITESSSDGLDRTTTLTYWRDPPTNIMAGRVEGRDPDPGGAECHQYDSVGRLASSFDNPGLDDVSECSPTGPIVGARQVDFSYDADGNLETQTEWSTPHDRVTTYTDYEYGSPKNTIVTTGTAEDIHYCREYHPLGMVDWETDGRGCDEAYRTSYAYDLYGRLLSTNPPLADPTTFVYLPDWSQVTVSRGGQQFEYSYDRFGNLTDIFNNQTEHWIQITNDALGRRRHVDLLWNPEPGDSFTYDPLGRLTAVIHPDTPSTQVTIDYAGSKVTVTDENLHLTEYFYEAFGNPADRRLATLVDAANETTSYGYDPVFGQLSSVTAPIAQGDRSFDYYTGSTDCDNGLLERETHPESGETTYEYDCLGAVTRRTRSGPEITIYDYDRAGRLTEIFYPDGAGTVSMGYDGASRRTSLTGPFASSVTTYDDAGRLETVTQSIAGGPQGHLTSYTYDTLDRLETITYPSGRVVSHGWDNRNWLESLTGEDGSGVSYLPSITYHDTGAPDLVTFANGIVTEHTIDERNRLTGMISPGIMNIGIEYDYASNVETWTDNSPSGKDRSYGYDELDRLTSATAPNMWGDLSFTYDELGNRQTRTLEGETTTYVYSSGTNRLDSLTGAETGAFTYDGAGRMATELRRAPGEIFSDGFESGDTSAWEEGGSAIPATLVYTFNSADQLTRIERGGQALGDYAFDGDGLRVSKTANGETVYYVRDPSGNTLAEYDENSTLLAEYVYASGRQVAKVEPDGGGGYDFSYFHPDHLGTALVITNGSGTVTWSGDYYPFGAEYSSTGIPDRYRFTQHELDPGTALIYAKARYYHPGIGRFLSVDPVGGRPGSSQTWHRYSYALNNPVAYFDPNGKAAHVAVGGLFGGLIGGGWEFVTQVRAGEGFNIAKIGTEAAQGMAIGAVAAATGGASLLASGVAVGGTTLATGVAGRALDLDSSTTAFDPSELTADAVGGFVGGAVGAKVGQEVTDRVARSQSQRYLARKADQWLRRVKNRSPTRRVSAEVNAGKVASRPEIYGRKASGAARGVTTYLTATTARRAVSAIQGTVSSHDEKAASMVASH